MSFKLAHGFAFLFLKIQVGFLVCMLSQIQLGRTAHLQLEFALGFFLVYLYERTHCHFG